MLFNEPKLLKSGCDARLTRTQTCFSALQRAEIAEMLLVRMNRLSQGRVSVLFNEPKLLKLDVRSFGRIGANCVSVLFNEPKLLKFRRLRWNVDPAESFSALQRAEIAEIAQTEGAPADGQLSFSALQRAEIAEIPDCGMVLHRLQPFQCSSTSRNC